jgi:hypothetical protein
MQPNRIDDPGHSDLRQHAIPPAKTPGQIVCYQTRTYLVSPTVRWYAHQVVRIWQRWLSRRDRQSAYTWTRA